MREYLVSPNFKCMPNYKLCVPEYTSDILLIPLKKQNKAYVITTTLTNKYSLSNFHRLVSAKPGTGK